MAQKKLVKHLRIGDPVYAVSSGAEIAQRTITGISKHDTFGIHMGNSKSEESYTDIDKSISFKMYYGGIAYVSMNDAIAKAKAILHESIKVLSHDIAKKTIVINSLIDQLNEYPKM